MDTKQSDNGRGSDHTQSGSQTGEVQVGKQTAAPGSCGRRVQKRASAPGRRTRVEARYGPPTGDAVHQVASAGVQGSGGSLPHLGPIQRSFGRHDVSNVQAHSAPEANKALGSEAYAMGNNVAFLGLPSLHTAAHEAAHVVQQRGGVQLKGGVGEVGDTYEQHADAVADKVVSGESAEALLDTMAGGSSAGTGVQRQAVQFWNGHEHRAVGNMAALIATGAQNFSVSNFVALHGNRDFQDPAEMSLTSGATVSPDPVLAGLERRGQNAVRIETNDTYVGGGQYAPPTRVQNDISLGAANEFGGDYSPTPQALARQNDDDNPIGNDFIAMVSVAETNINHFYPLHIAEYQRHHQLALAAARAGDRRTAMLEEGYGGHFLCDTFAAGHMAPRALDRVTVSPDEDEGDLGLHRSKHWHDALNGLPGGTGLPTTRGKFHGDDTMTGSELAIIATDVAASLNEVLTTLTGNPVAASFSIPEPDYGAIMTSEYAPLWRRMMGDYEQDLRAAENGQTQSNVTTDGGTSMRTSAMAGSMRANLFGGNQARLLRLGHTEWNGSVLVYNLTLEGRPAPVDSEVWVKWFDQDLGNDHAVSGRLDGTIAADAGAGIVDTDEEIGGPDRVTLTAPGIGAERAAVDDTNDSYAVFYSDSGCTVPIGRSRTQGNNQGRVAKPCVASGWSWSGATLSFNVRQGGQPVANKALYLRWYNQDSGMDRSSSGNLGQTIADTDSPVGNVQTIRATNGRASITAHGSANNSGDTYATVYLDQQCRIPLGRSSVQP